MNGLYQTHAFNRLPEQDITLRLNVDGSSPMGAGYAGAGTMSIADGVAVESTFGYIGYKAGSSGAVAVDGAGSTWTNSHWLRVGWEGNGTLNITGGGAVSSISGHIGAFSGSTGQVTVDGIGSTWTADFGLSIGSEGNGMLNISDGGALVSTGGIVGSGAGTYIGEFYRATGYVTVNGIGSTWTHRGVLYVGLDGGGTLNITDGALVRVARPVGGSRMLTIDYDENGDSFVNMAAGGMLALSGDADDSLAQVLELIDGTDAIRYWDNRISRLAPIINAFYGHDYSLEYLTERDLAGYTLLTVLAAGPAADFDGDFDIDGDDFLVWQSAFNNNANGDADNDGDTDGDDFLIWQCEFGGGSASISGTVPEPSSAILLIAIVLLDRLGRCLLLSRLNASQRLLSNAGHTFGRASGRRDRSRFHRGGRLHPVAMATQVLVRRRKRYLFCRRQRQVPRGSRFRVGR